MYTFKRKFKIYVLKKNLLQNFNQLNYLRPSFKLSIHGHYPYSHGRSYVGGRGMTENEKVMNF